MECASSHCLLIPWNFGEGLRILNAPLYFCFVLIKGMQLCVPPSLFHVKKWDTLVFLLYWVVMQSSYNMMMPAEMNHCTCQRSTCSYDVPLKKSLNFILCHFSTTAYPMLAFGLTVAANDVGQ